MANDSSDSGRQSWALAAGAILAMFAGIVGVPGLGDSAGRKGAAGTPGSDGAAAVADAPKASGPDSMPTVSQKDPRRPFQEFWEVAGPEAGQELARDLIDHGKALDPEFLIVTVPDPIDSRFGYRFDAVVDDVQMAVESLGWNFDRFWLPWQTSGQQPARRDLLAPIYDSPPGKSEELTLHFSAREGLKLSGRYDLPKEPGKRQPGEDSALHERHPGVLLFRRPRGDDDKDPRQQLMVVFLVGERPTSGVHKAALGEAFNVIDAVRRGGSKFSIRRALGTDFPIVGPYFTGSERSLSLAIAQWTGRRRGEIRRAVPLASWFAEGYPDPIFPKLRAIKSLLRLVASNQEFSRRTTGSLPFPLWRFSVRSGGANYLDKSKFIEDAGDDGQGPVLVEFDATVHHFDRVMRGLLHYLRDQNGDWPLGKVALLTESDTQFGNIIAPIVPTARRAARWGHEEEGVTITTMKFPFHVSQVAIAYDKNRQADDKAPAPALARPSSRLKIPFDETGSPRDIVPSLSPAMTAASDEFDLAKILETIAMEDYRYVGIVASDTRDVIFLAGLIREYCPDVQLFAPAGDLLLGHPTYASQLRGMIIGSPYPLFSMAQRWDPPYAGDHRRHLFIHESDQGYYNATLSLLGQREAAGPPGDPEAEERKYANKMYDYGKPFGVMDDLPGGWAPRPDVDPDDLGPPLWIGVIGQRGLWPLTFVPHSQDLRDVELARKRMQQHADPAVPSPQDDRDTPSIAFHLPMKDRPASILPLRPDKHVTNDVENEKWVLQFVPLIPQFAWFWGSITLALSAMALLILEAHRRLISGSLAPDVAFGAFRPIGARSAGGPWRATQEGLVYASIGLLGAVYAYFAAKPCRLTLRHSPWSVFLSRSRLGLLPWGDRWNWAFGLVAIVLAGATIAALTAAVAIRVRSAPRRPSPTTSVRIAWCVAMLILAWSLARPTGWQDAENRRELTSRISIPWAAGFMMACLVWIALPRLWEYAAKLRYRAKLLGPLVDRGRIPTAGKNLIVLADVNGSLHVRIFDGLGAVVIDTNQTKRPGLAQAFKDLKEKFKPPWSPHVLTRREEGRVAAAVASLVELSLKRSMLRLMLGFLEGTEGLPPPERGEDPAYPSPRLRRRVARSLVVLHFPAAVFLFSLGMGWYLDPPFEVFDGIVRAVDASILGLVALSMSVIAARYRAKDVALRMAARARETGAAPVIAARAPSSEAAPVIAARAPSSEAAPVIAARAPSSEAAADIAARPPSTGTAPDIAARARANKIELGLVVYLVPLLAGVAFLLVEAIAPARPPYDPLLFLERAVNLGNGVSPLVPVLLTGLAAGSWLRCQIRRVDDVDRLWKDRIGDEAVNALAMAMDEAPAFAVGKERKGRLMKASREVRELLDRTVPGPLLTNPACFVAIGVTLIVVVRLYERFVPTVDGLAYNRAMILAFGAMIAAVVLALCRFLLTWFAVRQVLREFALLPMQRAFDRVPKAVTRELGPYLNALRPRLENLDLTVRHWSRVAEGIPVDGLARGLYGKSKAGIDQSPIGSDKTAGCELAEVVGAFAGVEGKAAVGDDPGLAIMKLFEEECGKLGIEVDPSRSVTRSRLRKATGACLSVLLPFWRSRSLEDGYGETSHPPAHEEGDRAGGAAPEDAGGPGAWDKATRRWLEQLEDLLALQLVNFLSECTIHLKNQAAFLAIGPILLLLAASSYPFQPQRFLVVSIWTLLIAVSAGVLWAYVQMERNEVLSRISKTPPDRVSFNWTFLTQSTAILIPLLGAVIAQFPFVSDTFNQWLDPLVRTMK